MPPRSASGLNNPNANALPTKWISAPKPEGPGPAPSCARCRRRRRLIAPTHRTHTRTHAAVATSAVAATLVDET
jgi:hypothetical protein